MGRSGIKAAVLTLMLGVSLLLGGALQAATLDILVDADNNMGTGCTAPTPGGPFVGAEFIITTTINTGVYPPLVTGVTRRDCTGPGGGFSVPVTISAGGWPVGIGNGTGGYDVLETFFHVDKPWGSYRLGFVYGDANSGNDTLLTLNGQAGSDPIVMYLGPLPVIPTLAHGALLLLAFALAWFALRRLRRHRVSTLIVAGVLAAIVAGTTWAAIVMDGLITDWAGAVPVATDPQGDAPAGADLLAVFTRLELQTLYVRADVKVASPPTFTSGNAATFTVGAPGTFAITTFGIPAVSSITQGGTLPGGVSFVYTAGQSTASLAGTPAAGTGGIYPLTFGATNGVPPPGSQNFTLTINQAPAITSAAATNFIVGTAGTFTFAATGFPKPALTLTGCSPALPAGLAFTDNGNGSATLAGPAALGSVGVKNCTLTAGNGIGVPATQPFALTIGRAPTTTVTVSSVNPSVIGQPVTFTATVTATAPGTGTPTGTVQFMDGAGTLGAPQPLVAGVAAFSTGALILGPHPISAVYSSDADFTASTGSLPTQTVSKAATTTVVTSSLNPTVFGQPVTFTATVTTNPPGSGTPTGNVIFSIDGNPQTVAVNGSGVATFTTAALAAGPHPVGATYQGDANYSTSTGTLPTQTVNKADTGTVLGSAPNPGVFGQQVALTATVTATAPGAGIPTGTVNFFDGANPIGSAPLAGGVATLNTAALSTNAHMLSAQYAGDANFNTSTSNTLGHTVNKANTTTVVVSGANPSLFSQPVTFTATVAAVVPGAGTPTGTVTFRDGATPLCTAVALAGGTAGCTLSTLAVGGHSIFVDYSADTNFNASTSLMLPQSVNGAPTTTALNPGAATVFGQNATLTATVAIVAPGTAVPTGSVDFKEGPTTLGSGVLNGAGVATFSTTAFIVGPHNLTAVYVGNPSFLTSSGTAAKQVNQAGTTTALASNSNPSLSGGGVTFTATVAAVAPGAGIPTGTVQFKDGASNLGGAAALNGAGQAQVNTSALTPGAHTITAIYGGDTGFTGSNSTPVNQIVNLAPAFTSAAGTTFTVGAGAGSFPVAASGFPAPILIAGVCAPTLPAGVSFVGSGTTTMSIAGTPPAASGGTYTCALTAGNGIGSDATQNFVLTIDEAPAAVADPGYSVLHGTTLSVTVGGMPDGLLANDTGGFPAATIASFGGGSMGGVVTDHAAGTPVMFGPGHSLQVNADGSFTFTAAAGSFGNVTFEYRLHNSTAPDSDATVTIGVLKAPLFTSPATASFVPGAPGTFTVTTSGFPAPSLATGSFAPAAPWLSFTDNGNGTATLAGTPPLASTGSVTFTLTAHNIIAPDATQGFTLQLNTPPAITSANATTFTTGVLGTFTVTTTGFPTGASMLISESGALPAFPSGIVAPGRAGKVASSPKSSVVGVSFFNNFDGTATMSGVPTAGQGGVYPLIITANNGVAPNATQNFTLTVNDAPGTPTGSAAVTFKVGTAGSSSYTATGYPAPTFTLTGCVLPAEITMSPSGTLSGTPAAGTGGDFNCTVTASNGIGSPSGLPIVVHIQQAPTFTSANATTFTTGTPGSFLVTTAGFPTGASMLISSSGALPSLPNPGLPGRAIKVLTPNPPAVGVTFSNNLNGTATLSGVASPGNGGVYALNFTANNGVTPNGTQAFTLTVNDAPGIPAGSASVNFLTGTPGSTSYTATGYPAPTFTLTGCTLPGTLAMTTGGTLAGTAPVGSGGDFNCTVTASNGIGSPGTLPIVVHVQQPPAITSANAATFTAGTPGTFTVTTTGFPTGASMVIAATGTLPGVSVTGPRDPVRSGPVALKTVGGVTFVDNHNGTATLSGIPGPTSGGTYTLNITANNGVVPQASQSFTLTVNQAPAITAANTAKFTEGASGTFTVTTTGFPTGASMVISQGGALPAGTVAFVDNHNGTATLSGVPNVGTSALGTGADPGLYPLTIGAANGVLPTASQSFNLRVCPVITPGNLPQPTTGNAYTPTVTATGGAAPLTFALSANTLTGASMTSAGVFSGIVTATGAYSFDVTATDAHGCTGVRTYSGTVNVPPAVGADTYQVVGNTAFVVHPTTDSGTGPHLYLATAGLLANDNDGNGGANGTGVTAVAGTFATTNAGSITIAADGTFSYLPPANFTGADTYTYTVSDGIGTGTGTVTLNVSAKVWYVKNDVGSTGNGTSGSPFKTLAEAQTASAANDTIFVFTGDGATTGQNSGIVLKAGQRLIGQGIALTANGTFNTVAGPTLLAAGTHAQIGNAGGDGVLASNIAGVVIRGLSIGGSQHAVNVNTTSGANSGSATIADNVIRLPGTDGIHVASAGSGTLDVAIQRNNVTGAARGISVQKTAGTLTITAFDGNAVSGNTTGIGVDINGAVFDAVPGNPITTVSGGALSVGASGNGVGTSGVLLANVTGDLSFTDLDIYNDAGTGLLVSSTGALNAGAGTGFRLAVAAGVSTIDSTGGPAIDVNNASFNLPSMVFLRSTSSTTTGVSLVNAFGGAGVTTLSASSGQISDPGGASGTAFNVSGGTGNISFGGTITNASGNSVVVANRTSDAVSFSGAITDNGSGISLTSNTGSTINFTGGLSISSGSNTAFNATGGGTVNVTQNNTSIVNTLTAASGTALNVANTAIGASGLTFRSISAGSGIGSTGNGITLNGTGASGGLTVTGNGSAGSGGTIQHKTGADASASSGTGIYLTNTSNVSLTRMQLNDFDNFAIRGFGVTNFTLDNSVISGANGNSATENEGSISFGANTGEPGGPANGLTGSATISNSNISGGFEDNVRVTNQSGSLNRLTISNSTIGPNNITNGNDGVLIEGENAATINVTVTNSTIFGARGTLFAFILNGNNAADLSFTGNTLSNPVGYSGNSGSNGLTLISGANIGGGALTTYSITGNTFRDANGHAVLLVKATDPGSLTGTFSNNTIGVAAVNDSGSFAGSGIKIQNAGLGTLTTTVTNNTIRQYNNFGIEMLTGGSATFMSGAFNATVSGNTIGSPGTGGLPMNGIHLNGGTVVGDTYQICAKIGANSITGSGANAGTDIRVRQRQSTTVRLPGYGGAATDFTAVQNFLIAQVGGGPTALASVNSPPGGGFTGTGTTCP